MKCRHHWIGLTLLSVGMINTIARADFIVYNLHDDLPKMVIEGGVINHGRTVTYSHPKFGQTYLNRDQCQIINVPDRRKALRTRLAATARKGSANELFELSRECLRHGWSDDYLATVEQVLKLDPEHERAKQALALKEQVNAELPESSETERQFRELVPLSKMRTVRSAHFLMLTDTPERPEKGEKQNRAEQRLELLERVYQTFLFFFQSHGTVLDVPTERLKVVLFEEHQDYLNYATSLSEELRMTAGFYDRMSGISYFYDHSSDEIGKFLQKQRKSLANAIDTLKRASGSGRGDIIRQLKGFDLLFQVWQEEQDITVVTHETTHQLAGRCGLFPDRVGWPSWIHEGLATYFEAPQSAGWSGIGAVNEERIRWYRGLEKDREHSKIEFIVGDQIFKFAGSHSTILHGYGQAWAITHFLMDRHFDKLMAFYGKLSLMPRDVFLSPDLLNQVFDSVFDPKDRSKLDLEWRHYMSNLKTDFQEVSSR